jgi:L-alanine-DL-glutamate epimerase-like enolase superfamily enzyme
MRIKNLRAFQLHLPFRFSFTHAHIKRKSSQNIIVETVLDSGTKGYGESLPRDYVTGETAETVLKVYEGLNLNDLSRDFSNYEEVVSCLREHGFLKEDDRENNAARCALEMSILDAFSKEFNVPILSFYTNSSLTLDDPLPVSGVISLGRSAKLMAYLSWAKALRFSEVKIKVSGEVRKDIKRVGVIRRTLGSDVAIRIDANMAYSFEEALEFLRGVRRYEVVSIEDPVKDQDLDRLPELKALTNAEIILDEPVCTLAEVQKFLDKSYFDTINIRLSKCGGFIKSLEIADFLWEKGKGIQLGCQVGETSILTSAGYHFMKHFGCLTHYEGGYEGILLSRRITEEKFSIRRGGYLENNIKSNGLGVTILDNRLTALSPQPA